MMDIDQFEAVLDTIANTLPPAFYEEKSFCKKS